MNSDNLTLMQVRLSLSDFLRVRSSASSGGHAMELRKSMLRIFSTLVPQDKKQLSSESINSFKYVLRKCGVSC